MKEIIKKYSKIIGDITEFEELEAEKYLTKIAGDYELSTEEDMTDLIDAIVELSNSEVVTIEQLITALSQASETLSSTDNNLEKLALWAGLTAEVTKENGKIIGNFLKSFASRINGIEEVKEVLKEEAGIEDFSKTSEVVDSLVSKWNSFSDKKKEEIAVKVAGRFQMARFMVLIEQLAK